MAREVLTMIVGRTEDFNALGFDLGTNRKSIDGTLVLIHREHLSSVELNSILVDVMQYKSPFYFIGDSAMEEMLLTKEWASAE
jgi:hypothetical protein